MSGVSNQLSPTNAQMSNAFQFSQLGKVGVAKRAPYRNFISLFYGYFILATWVITDADFLFLLEYLCRTLPEFGLLLVHIELIPPIPLASRQGKVACMFMFWVLRKLWRGLSGTNPDITSVKLHHRPKKNYGRKGDCWEAPSV